VAAAQLRESRNEQRLAASDAPVSSSNSTTQPMARNF
jgi:hypothetical protein